MKKLLYFFICFTTILNAKSQTNQKLDSLKKVLTKLPAKGNSYAGDTMRVRVLCEMGEVSLDPDSAIYILRNANKLSQIINYVIGNQKSTFLLGRKNKTKGTYFEAISQYYKSLSYAEKIGDDLLKARCFQEIADSYGWIKQEKKCYELYDSALKIYKSLGYYEEYADCLNNLALVYFEEREYNIAINLLKECLRYERFINGKQSMPSFYCNLGSVYREKGDLDSSLFYYKLSSQIQIKEDPNYRLPYAILLIETAKAYFKKNEIDKSIEYSEKAFLIGNQLGGTQFEVNEVLYQAYKAKKNNTKALFYLENLIEANRKSNSQDISRRLEALKFEYENDRQKTEIEIQKSTIKNSKLLQKILWVSIFIVLSFFGLQIYNNSILKRKNNLIEFQKSEIEELNQSLEKKVEVRTLELSNANDELILKNKEITEALFKGQTIERKRVASELHDNLGSTLSALKWRLEAINGEDLREKERKIYNGIVEMMKNAYSEVRHISHNLLPQAFEQLGLIGAIEKIVNEINENGKIEIKLNTGNFDSSKLNQNTELEFYAIIMELTNNILKHSQATKALITFHETDDKLCITVADNGKGINLLSTNGKGLTSIKERVETVNGQLYFQNDAQWSTIITLSINL